MMFSEDASNVLRSVVHDQVRADSLSAICTILALCILLAGRLGFVVGGHRKPGLPPGPPTLPIIGNLHLLEHGAKRITQYAEWHKTYGPIISVKVGSNDLLVLGGDSSLVRDLLDKKGSIYSGRPHRWLAETLDAGESPIFEQSQAKWRMNRRLLVQYFLPVSSTFTKENFVPVIEAESTQLLHDLLHDPANFMQHPVRFSSSVMTSLIYGIRGPTYESPSVYGIETIMNAGGELNAICPPVDSFPFLKYLPDFVWPWRDAMARMVGLRKTLYKDLADRALKNSGIETFARKISDFQKVMGLSDRRVHMILAVAHEGGSDIVAIAILVTIMALVNNPEVYKKAAAEVDSVCDDDALPVFSDWGRLPYIRKIVKESLRWRPPFPFGVPHALEEDDIWNGYFLPKGSTIMLNIWNIHMNPERYEDPEAYKPERFDHHPLTAGDYINQPDAFYRDHFAFGAGRRHCPGSHIADIDLFLVVSKLIWAFEFTSPTGQPIDTKQETAFIGQNLRRPAPFDIKITPRSPARVNTIEREMKAAEDRVFSLFEDA